MILGLEYISHCRGVTSRPKSLWFNKKSLYTPGPVYFNRKKHSELVKLTRVHFFIFFVGTHSRKNAKQNTVFAAVFCPFVVRSFSFSMILMTLAFAMPSLWKIMLKAKKWPVLAFQYIVWIPAGGKRQKPEADSTRDKMLGWIIPLSRWERSRSYWGVHVRSCFARTRFNSLNLNLLFFRVH